MKRKNTRAPCRIRREGITCRGVVPFVFRRRRDVLFFSFFLKKTRRGSGRLVFLFFRRGVLPPTFIAINLPAICRGGIHPSRTPSAAASGHGGQRAGRPTYDPGRAADLRGAIAANLPAICRGRIHAARNLPPNPFYGQSVGEGFIPPGHFPPPQASTAARGLAALQPPLKCPHPAEKPADI